MTDKTREESLAEDLIVYLSQKVDGIGDKKSNAVAAYFTGDIASFREADAKVLSNIPTQKGKLLTPSQAQELFEVINNLDKSISALRDLWISVLIEDFASNVVNLINRTTLLTPDSKPFDDTALTINPLLIKALHMNTPEDVIKFFLSERLTRSIATSWGMRVEEFVGISGAELLSRDERKGDLKGFDLRKIRDGLTYYVQLKSSTNTMNVDAVRQLDERFDILESKSGNYRAMLGTSFGKRPSDNLLTYLKNPQERIKVGEEFWDWIAEEEGFFKKLVDLIEYSGSKQLQKSFSDLYDDKYEDLLIKWQEVYGEGKASVDRFVTLYT